MTTEAGCAYDISRHSKQPFCCPSSCRHGDRVLEKAARVEPHGHFRGVSTVCRQQGPVPQ
jgi:hypothetical protein